MPETAEAEYRPSTLSGTRKAAIFLLALDTEVAGLVMSRLGREMMEEVTRELANLNEVDPRDRDEVIQEFCHIALASRNADRVIEQVEHPVYQQPFSFLHKTENENLLMFIQKEHPQTIALVMAHLPSSRAAEILMGLPSAKQIEVVSRVARMEQTTPEVIQEVERGLEQRLSGVMSPRFRSVGGVEAAAEMLNLSDRSTEKGILESLESENPDLVEQIRRLMFVFEDILLVNDKGIQAVLKAVDNDELALALRTASDELKEKIFGNMSERAVQLIEEEMEYMGPVRVGDVEGAQQKIVEIVGRLEDAGEIIISGRGGDTDPTISGRMRNEQRVSA